MAEISRIRVRWGGWSGAPGVSTFYLSGTGYTAALNGLHAFFEQLKIWVPTGITMTVPSEGDILDEFTGTLTGQWAAGAEQVSTGTGNGGYMAGGGALVQWHTSQIHNGRRLRGHTFLVPLGAFVYDANGRLLAGNATAIAGWANTLISAAGNELCVWGRPKAGANGLHGDITNATCSVSAAMLRSRRD